MENAKQKAIEVAYKITEEEIKEGDFVVNTSNKKNPPRLVVSKNGILGVNLTGWFSWSPILRCHKKVIFNSIY